MLLLEQELLLKQELLYPAEASAYYSAGAPASAEAAKGRFGRTLPASSCINLPQIADIVGKGLHPSMEASFERIPCDARGRGRISKFR